MKTHPQQRRPELSARFERAVRRLPGEQKRWLLGRLRAARSGRLERDFWVFDMASGQWRRL